VTHTTCISCPWLHHCGRLKAFNPHVTVVRARAAAPDADMGAHRQHIDEYGAGVDDLHRLLPAADVVVLTCTQNDATRGIVGSEFLRRCKRGVRIVNVARGGLLDYDAVRQVSPSSVVC
jgi:phosphoglycerate dehydrogenase-like enzyme